MIRFQLPLLVCALALGTLTPRANAQFADDFPGFSGTPMGMGGSSAGQGTSPIGRQNDRTDVRGEVKNLGGANARVVLRGGFGHGLSADVSPTGNFEFYSVPAGNYELQVVDSYGNPLHRQFVNVMPDFPSNLEVVLDESRTVERPMSGIVSLKQLQHKPVKAAQKEFKAGMKLASKGKRDEAVARMAKAVELDPEWLDAVNTLGAFYFEAGDNEKALEMFRRALAVNPKLFAVQVNMTLALMKMNKAADAEHPARQAVELDGTSAKARYLLGAALVSQGKNTGEALQHLKIASKDIPRARILMAQAMANSGNVSEAREQLEQYVALANANPQLKQAAQNWIARLTPAN